MSESRESAEEEAKPETGTEWAAVGLGAGRLRESRAHPKPERPPARASGSGLHRAGSRGGGAGGRRRGPPAEVRAAGAVPGEATRDAAG